MATSPVLAARDDFERHYAEKIWALIPGVYKQEDLLANPPGQLRAFVELLAGEAAVARRSIDRLLADSRIEEADDWAVPYIGALLGTRMLGSTNPAGRRADVGHTIHYRRRAGTRHLLELLAHDIAQWDSVAVDAFRQLGRTGHMLDTEIRTGPVTRTPQGGLANLRTLRAMDVLDGPFDDMSHHADMQRGKGLRGLYNIPNVNLFIFRQHAFPLNGVTPFQLDTTHYTLDPSGRDVPLFQPGILDPEECADKSEWEVRAPITCRRLNAASYRLADDPAHPVSWEPLIGRTFFDQPSLLDAATGLAGIVTEDLLRAALAEESPKAHLLAPGFGNPAIDLAVASNPAQPSFEPHDIAGAGLAGWAAPGSIPAWVDLLLDPERGRVQLKAPPPGAKILDARLLHYGIFYPVGAGGHDRRRTVPAASPLPPASGLAPAWGSLNGDSLIADSRTYAPAAAAGVISVTGDSRLWATSGERPYVTLSPPAAQRTITFTAAGGTRSIELNGLWLGLLLTGVAPRPDLAEIVFSGSWERILLRDVTIDPGGQRAPAPSAIPAQIPHVRIVIEGTVEELIVERSILGSIAERGLAGGAPCTAASIAISDSIVHGYPGEPALAVSTAALSLDRSTVVGDCLCGRADISESIIDGQLEVEDAQASCFRFSTARSGGRIPAQYESVVLPDGLPPGSFVSRRFGDPGYMQLSEICPPEVAAGAEHGTEMGVFNRALDPIRQADLRAKMWEYAPVQARVQFVFVT
jgi:hypothetical protein